MPSVIIDDCSYEYHRDGYISTVQLILSGNFGSESLECGTVAAGEVRDNSVKELDSSWMSESTGSMLIHKIDR